MRGAYDDWSRCDDWSGYGDWGGKVIGVVRVIGVDMMIWVDMVIGVGVMEVGVPLHGSREGGYLADLIVADWVEDRIDS